MSLAKFKFEYLLFNFLLCLAITNVNAQTQLADSVDFKNQETKFEPLYNIPGSFSSMKVDALENVYAISEASLIKYSPIDKSVLNYNNVKRYGAPSLLDVSNPFKTLLYFKNYATIIVLDKYLANKNTINLRKNGIFSVNAIGSTYDNKIWIFDEQDFKLKKIDDDGTVLMESNDLRIITEEAPIPSQIFDHEGFVYLYDAKAGIFIFDHYGTFNGKLPYNNWNTLSVSNGYFYGLVNNKVFSYEIKTKLYKEYQLSLSFINSISIVTINGKIYLLNKNGIEVLSPSKN